MSSFLSLDLIATPDTSRWCASTDTPKALCQWPIPNQLLIIQSKPQGHISSVFPDFTRRMAFRSRKIATIQEQFVDYHEDLLFTDLEGFNRKLAEWLVDYNTVLPHHSLGLKPPVKWLLENHPECQRYWTNTRALMPHEKIYSK